MNDPDPLAISSGLKKRSNPRLTGSGRRARRRRPSSRNSTRQTSPPGGKVGKMHTSFVDEPRKPEMMAVFEEKLKRFPDPCPKLKLVGMVGEGTFSNVYLVHRKSDTPESREEKRRPSWRRRYAIKHLVPNVRPERIITEIECFRICGGINNVLPLLFCHRLEGEVIFAMPFLENTKFIDMIEDMDFVEMKFYLKNLLIALNHIHSLGIIHRDVKPANFLYDRTKKKFGLVDFGLAQRCEPLPPLEPTERPKLECKKRLTSADFEGTDLTKSPEPTIKARKIALSPGRGRRPVLEDTTQHEASVLNMEPPENMVTPSKKIDPPAPYYYDKRGSLLKASPKKKTSHRDRLAASSVVEGQHQIHSDFMLRRSPRKHPGSVVSPVMNSAGGSAAKLSRLSSGSGYSTFKIAGNTLYPPPLPPPPGGNSRDPSPQQASSNRTMSRANSFTMLDPTSGIPSPRASLTPHQSTIGNWPVAGFNGFYPPGFGPLGFLHPSQTMEVISQNLQLSTRSFNKIPAPVVLSNPEPSNRCGCFGKPMVCNRCTSRRNQKVTRAGTPGFRPPEVLLKYDQQTTAVDMWAVGVILLSMLTRTYPFFRAHDDMYSVGEIAAIHGTEKMIELAGQYGKKLIFSDWRPKVDLFKVCHDLSQRQFSHGHRSGRVAPYPSITTPEVCDLLEKLLTPFHSERISAERALQHPLFNEGESD